MSAFGGNPEKHMLPVVAKKLGFADSLGLHRLRRVSLIVRRVLGTTPRSPSSLEPSIRFQRPYRPPRWGLCFGPTMAVGTFEMCRAGLLMSTHGGIAEVAFPDCHFRF